MRKTELRAYPPFPLPDFVAALVAVVGGPVVSSYVAPPAAASASTPAASAADHFASAADYFSTPLASLRPASLPPSLVYPAGGEGCSL